MKPNHLRPPPELASSIEALQEKLLRAYLAGLESSNPRVRKKAARGLGTMGPAAAAAPFRRPERPRRGRPMVDRPRSRPLGAGKDRGRHRDAFIPPVAKPTAVYALTPRQHFLIDFVCGPPRKKPAVATRPIACSMLQGFGPLRATDSDLATSVDVSNGA